MSLLDTWGFPDSSVGKESTCNAGDASSIPGLGRSAGEGIRLPTPVYLGFPCGNGREWNSLLLQRRRPGLDPGLGRSPEGGKGYPPSVLAWRIPWTVQSMGSQRVGND